MTLRKQPPKRNTTSTRPRAGRGRPALILDGYDAKRGEWAPRSPVGMLLSATRSSLFLYQAAAVAGLSRSVVEKYLAVGREHNPGPDADRDNIDQQWRPYVDLVRAMSKAEVIPELQAHRTIADAIQAGDWRAAYSFLRLRFPERYAVKQTIQHEGLPEPQSSDDARRLTVVLAANPDLAEAMDRLAEALEQP